jgi:kynurenine formamidase
MNTFMKKLIDLSHTVEHGMITYKGLPAPIIGDFLSREASKSHYAEGTTFHIGRIDMVANTDSLNIDDISGGERPVHSTLLGADIPIAEHLCGLEQLPDTAFKFHAVPVKVKHFGTFPVRAYALLES